MGCCGITNQNNASTYHSHQLNSIQAIVGKLKITIKTIHLKTPHINTQCYEYIKLKMSNQQFNTKMKTDHKNYIPSDTTCQFTINSSNKKNGRFLIVQIWEESSKIERNYGKSIINVTPFLKDNLSQFQKQKNYIVKNKEQNIGQIVLNFHFQPCHFDYFHIRINALFIRKNSKIDKWCSVRIAIGEEILETKPKKSEENSVPSWKNQPLHFMVPAFIHHAQVVVLSSNGQSKEILGQLKLDMQSILRSHNQLMHSEVLTIDNMVTGSITFDTSKDQNDSTNFIDMQAISPRKVMKNLSSQSSSQFEIPKQNKLILPSRHLRHSLTESISSEKSISTLSMTRPKGKLPPLKTRNSQKPTIKHLQSFDKIQEQMDENKLQSNQCGIKLIELPQQMIQQHMKIRKQPQNFSILKLIPIQQSRIDQDTSGTKLQYSFMQNPINVLNETNKIEHPFGDSFMNNTLNISEIHQDQIPTRLQSGKFVYDIFADTMKYGDKKIH